MTYVLDDKAIHRFELLCEFPNLVSYDDIDLLAEMSYHEYLRNALISLYSYLSHTILLKLITKTEIYSTQMICSMIFCLNYKLSEQEIEKLFEIFDDINKHHYIRNVFNKRKHNEIRILKKLHYDVYIDVLKTCDDKNEFINQLRAEEGI